MTQVARQCRATPVFCPFLLVFFAVSQPHGARAAAAQPSYHDLYAQFRALEIDLENVATVRDFVLQRDVGRFELREGTLYLCTPIVDRVHAAIFVGNGGFSFTPPTQVEREQLFRFYEREEYSSEFNLLFLVFTDGTLSEFQSRFDFAPGRKRDRVGERLENCLTYILREDLQLLDAGIVEAFLNGPESDYFYGHFSQKDVAPHFWEIRPDRVEEVQFLRRPTAARHHHVREAVCSFHRASDYTSGMDLERETKSALIVDSYELDVRIENDLKVTATATLELEALRPRNWIALVVSRDAEVDSIWSEYGPVTYHAKKDNPRVWIECQPPLHEGTLMRLSISYRGNLVRRVSNEHFEVIPSTSWYPHVAGASNSGSSFDVTFRHPKQFDVVCIGDKVSQSHEGDKVVSRWVTRQATSWALFGFGFFREEELREEGLPPVFLYLNETKRDRQRESVRTDVLNSLRLFQSLFGDCPPPELTVVGSGQLHGTATDGFVNLGRVEGSLPGDWWGSEHVFRAHEIAHQWWGTAVRPQSYHDQWISEAFATYSSLLYLQAGRKNKEFFEHLKHWRERILNHRNYLVGSGREAGPIWLGSRTSALDTEGDYSLVIYRKGAWVLHMLRTMLIDFDTQNEDRFMAMMRDFYRTYQGRLATTTDFKRIVEKHLEMNMDWFFEQWVYGTGIPEYEFAHKVVASEAEYVVHCQVRQKNVPDDFRAYVPIRLDFGDDRWAIVRVLVKGPFSEFTLPKAPVKPKRVEFNPFESVLCESKAADWRETRP